MHAWHGGTARAKMYSCPSPAPHQRRRRRYGRRQRWSALPCRGGKAATKGHGAEGTGRKSGGSGLGKEARRRGGSGARQGRCVGWCWSSHRAPQRIACCHRWRAMALGPRRECAAPAEGAEEGAAVDSADGAAAFGWGRRADVPNVKCGTMEHGRPPARQRRWCWVKAPSRAADGPDGAGEGRPPSKQKAGPAGWSGPPEQRPVRAARISASAPSEPARTWWGGPAVSQLPRTPRRPASSVSRRGQRGAPGVRCRYRRRWPFGEEAGTKRRCRGWRR